MPMLINTMRLRSPHLAARVMGEAARTLAVDRYGQAEVTRRFAEDLLGPGSSESGSGT